MFIALANAMDLPFRFTYFSIGALLVFSFHAFAAILLLSIRDASRATRYLGTASAFLAGNSFAFFLAHSLLTPAAAYHRWLILCALPSSIYYVRFFFQYPRPIAPAWERIVFWLMWMIAASVAVYYIITSAQAPVKFVFDGHFWTFDVPAADRVLGNVITLQVLFTLCIALGRAVFSRGRERRATLYFLFVLMLIFLIPGVANGLSRSGQIDRVGFMNIYVLSMVVGVFALLVLHMNTTGDRTTIMTKIIGISFAVFLLMLQWTALDGIGRRVEDRAHLRLAEARLHVAGGTTPNGLVYSRPADRAVSPGNFLFQRDEAGRPGTASVVVTNTDGSTEVAFLYEEYRKFVHLAALPFVYLWLAGVLVILFGFRLFFRGVLELPLRSLLGGVDRIHQGDLSVRLPVHVQDELGFLSGAFNGMVESLHDTRRALDEQAGGVREMAESLATSAEQMNKTTRSFNESAQNQAASTEEISATIEEISAGQENVADHASDQVASIDTLSTNIAALSALIRKVSAELNNHRNLNQEVLGLAQSGRDSLEGMTSSMERISRSSARVTEIIEIISDISDRINLLALNAAIEAARAGAAGRGFAVVADEVGRLAEKTAESIVEIRELVDLNSGEITTGMDRVQRSASVTGRIITGMDGIGKMFLELHEMIRNQLHANDQVNQEADRVRDRADAIYQATEEQKLAVQEIVRSITNITENTTSVARGAEEMAAAAGDVAQMAEALNARTGAFHTKVAAANADTGPSETPGRARNPEPSGVTIFAN